MPEKRTIERACDTCGEAFSFYVSRARRGLVRFCSRPCYWKFCNRTETHVCAQCGNLFESRVTVPTRRFCGRICALNSTRKIQLIWQDRFWLKVQRTESCWFWIGGQRRGYGEFTKTWASTGRSADRQSATHLAWLIATGEEVPDTMMVGHTCDAPLCVRNDESGVYLIGETEFRREGHLFLCTPADNMKDMAAKGRNGNAKLTPDNVRDIRRRHFDEGVGPAAFVHEYGVTRATIRSLLKGRTWQHI